MNLRTLVLTISLLCSQATSASWLDNVGTLIDNVLAPNTTAPQSELIATVSSQHNLPAHWRTYWLDETEFGTRIFLAETGKITAPVVMLIHGLGQNGLRDWLTIVPELEQHYRVVMIDLPGFANSPSPKIKLSPTRYADLLHIVKPYFSTNPISVVGHSMGGAVTLRYAQRHPADISQIALIDAAGILQRTAFVKHSATDRLPTNPDTMPNTLLTYAVGLQDISNNLIEKMLRLPDPTVLLGKSELAWGATLQSFPNINAALSLSEEDFSSAVFEQTKPVFILWGGKDLVAPPRTGQLLVANLVSSELRLIEEAGHVPMASHPKDVSQWLLESLNTQPKSIAQPVIENSIAKQNYDCAHSTGDTLHGRYARITLKECTAVLLNGVIADELIVMDSIVEIQHSHFMSKQTSLTINDSVVMMTGGSISGSVNLDKARIDFAGVRLTPETPFLINRKSRLTLSVSRAGEKRYLHSDMQLEKSNY